MFAKPQKGLVPLGNNFYATPNTAQSPNYDDPFSESFVELEKDIIFDGCNLGIQLTPVLGFMRLPSFQLLWRNPSPGCTPEVEPPPPVDDSPYPLPDNPGCPIGLTIIFPFYDRKADEYGTFNDGENEYSASNTAKCDLISVRRVLPTEPIEVGFYYNPFQGNIPIYAEWEIVYSWVFSAYRSWDEYRTDLAPEGNTYTETGSAILYVNTFYDALIVVPLSFQQSEPGSSGIDFTPLVFTYEYSSLGEFLPGVTVDQSGTNPDGSGGSDINSVITVTKRRIFYICDEYKPPTFVPPPPPKKKCCNAMTCCPPPSNDLIRLVLKRIGSLPAQVPDLITKEKPAMVQKESLAELILWHVKQLDAIAGQFPIKITIKDTDLFKSGNQSKTVEIPNLAEAIAEILGLLTTLRAESEVTLNGAVKGMIEAGAAKQASATAVQVGLACAEFLGFEMKQTKQKIAYTFTPGKQDLASLMEPSEQEMLSYENTDKEDYRDSIRPLLEHATRWNAQNFRHVKPDSGYADLFKSMVQNPQETAAKIQEIEKKDFSEVLEDIEYGYTRITGATNTTEPYGNDIQQRPRIREIGQDEQQQLE